jgi:hypothetical protein
MTAKRQHFLEEVFKYDAHSVLKYLLEVLIKHRFADLIDLNFRSASTNFKAAVTPIRSK